MNEHLGNVWQSFEKSIQYTCALVSLSLNTILIILILTISPAKFGLYKYLMMYISIFEAVYSIWDVVTEPKVHSHGSAFIVFRIFKNTFFDRSESFYLIVTYCGFFGFSLAIFGVHFIYRYGAINKDFQTKYLNGSRIYMLFVIPIIYGICWAHICYLFFRITPESDEYMRDSILTSYDISIESISYIIVLFNPIDDSGVAHSDPFTFFAIACLWFEIFSSMFCVFYFGIRCYLEISRALRSNSLTSKVTKSLQQQLFQALVVQTTIPVILMYIPIAVLFLFPMLNFDIGFVSSFVAYTIALYPAIDPLPNMFIIKSYRKAVYELISMIICVSFKRAFPLSCTDSDNNSRYALQLRQQPLRI